MPLRLFLDRGSEPLDFLPLLGMVGNRCSGCKSAQGFDADRHDKSLKDLKGVGSWCHAELNQVLSGGILPARPSWMP